MITSAGLHFHLHCLFGLSDTNDKKWREKNNKKLKSEPIFMSHERKKKCKYHQLVSTNHQAREFRFTFLLQTYGYQNNSLKIINFEHEHQNKQNAERKIQAQT